MNNRNEEFLSIEQACAEELPWLSPGALRKLITRHKIPFRKPGGRLVLIRSELREWVKKSPGVRLSQFDE
ncbi:MAG: DNA-binding protein [Desulfobacteraceae bacterium]|nr:MAG: DNA-binding protein [Desulfobacteraceae bacterium]